MRWKNTFPYGANLVISWLSADDKIHYNKWRFPIINVLLLTKPFTEKQGNVFKIQYDIKRLEKCKIVKCLNYLLTAE